MMVPISLLKSLQFVHLLLSKRSLQYFSLNHSSQNGDVSAKSFSENMRLWMFWVIERGIDSFTNDFNGLSFIYQLQLFQE